MKTSEEALHCSAEHLVNSVALPQDLRLVPPRLLQRQYRLGRILLTMLSLLLVASVTLGAFNMLNQYLHLPGTHSLFQRKDGISHSIEHIVCLEQDGITHEIAAAYLQKGTLHLTVFQHPTQESISADSRFGVAYTVFYQGEECPQTGITWGSPSQMSFSVPQASKNEELRLSVYRGKSEPLLWVGDILLSPLDSLQSSPKGVTVDQVTLFAKARSVSDFTEISISAILPDGADSSVYDIVENRYFGFAEEDLVFTDSSGVSYPTLFDQKGQEDGQEETAYLRLWHRHRFLLPDSVRSGTLTVSSVSYLQKKNGHTVTVTLYGPWKIPLSW